MKGRGDSTSILTRTWTTSDVRNIVPYSISRNYMMRSAASVKVPTERIAMVEGGVSLMVDGVRIGAPTQGCLQHTLVTVLTSNDQGGVAIRISYVSWNTPALQEGIRDA